MAHKKGQGSTQTVAIQIRNTVVKRHDGQVGPQATFWFVSWVPSSTLVKVSVLVATGRFSLRDGVVKFEERRNKKQHRSIPSKLDRSQWYLPFEPVQEVDMRG